MAGSGPLQSDQSGITPSPEQARARTIDPAALLGRLWQQSLPLVRNRVHRLEQLAQQGSATGCLSAEDRTEAADIAHKLAGSLGMFGYPKGTEIAREMEHMIEHEDALDAVRLHHLSKDLRSLLSL